MKLDVIFWKELAKLLGFGLAMVAVFAVAETALSYGGTALCVALVAGYGLYLAVAKAADRAVVIRAERRMGINR